MTAGTVEVMRGIFDGVTAMSASGGSIALEDYVDQLTKPLITGHPITHSTLNAFIVVEVARILRDKKHLNEDEYNAVVEKTQATIEKNRRLLTRSDDYFQAVLQVGIGMAESFVERNDIYPQDLAAQIRLAELMISRDALISADAVVITRRRAQS